MSENGTYSKQISYPKILEEENEDSIIMKKIEENQIK